jgi:hypothetical protein
MPKLKENGDCLAVLSETNRVFFKGSKCEIIKNEAYLSYVKWHPFIIPDDAIEVCCVCVRAYARAHRLGLSGGWIVPSTGKGFLVTGPFCLPFDVQLLIPFTKT